ncbi:vWA domain-containing protein [Criblamydia sequanensis]|uniref:Conserved putative membrane protein n=1 Tax=Candidatus Criblamydia sequanensis CRIB-18 TaxID=1437425 RepID=A0A090E1J4_9BACT|nr:VWA domain-containing protein [Criblamydia sequanensis]CDR34614.1 Conserved putative membrane protein [Criblamydia sequanensis CRIB-18]
MSLDFFWTVIAISLALLGFFLYKLKNSFEAPGVYLSTVQAFSSNKTFKEKYYWLPEAIAYLSLATLLMALAGPHLEKTIQFQQKEGLPPPALQKGLAIYLLLDHSGSMYQEVSVPSSTGLPQNMRKIDLSKELTKKFVLGDPKLGLKGRGSDLIGLVAFARTAQIISPFSLDHEAIANEIDRLTINRDINQIGTSIGYAIFKTVNEIAATKQFAKEMDKEKGFTILNSIIIVITDGFQETNPNDEKHPLRSIDVFQAAEAAKKEGIKIYVVNIEPKLSTPEYASNRELFNLVTKYTGGKFFMVESGGSLADIYREIDTLEKSEVPAFLKSKKNEPTTYTEKKYFSFFLMKAALGLLLLHLIIKLFVISRVP